MVDRRLKFLTLWTAGSPMFSPQIVPHIHGAYSKCVYPSIRSHYESNLGNIGSPTCTPKLPYPALIGTDYRDARYNLGMNTIPWTDDRQPRTLYNFYDYFYRWSCPMCTTGIPQGHSNRSPNRVVDRHKTSSKFISQGSDIGNPSRIYPTDDETWLSSVLDQSRAILKIGNTSMDGPTCTNTSNGCLLWRSDDVLRPTKDIKSPESVRSILFIK